MNDVVTGVTVMPTTFQHLDGRAVIWGEEMICDTCSQPLQSPQTMTAGMLVVDGVGVHAPEQQPDE